MKKTAEKKKQKNETGHEECLNYKKHIFSRLAALEPVFARAAVGDYSEDVKMYEKDDEFTKTYVGVQVMLEVMRDKIAELDERNDQTAGEAIRRTAKLHESNWALDRQTKIIDTIFKNVEEGVIVADKNGKFLLFNAAAEKISGLGLRDVPPEQWSKEYGIFYPDTVTPLPPEENPLARALTGATSKVEVFVKNAAMPQGIFVVGIGAPIRNTLGELIGGVVVFQDITDRKLREKKLEIEVEKRTQELKEKVAYLEQARAVIEKQNTELQELDRLKTEFVSLASHQMRTPLSTAAWYIEMIADEEVGPLSGPQKNYLKKIYDANKRMSRLLDTFLNVSRIETNAMQPKLACLTVSEIYEPALEEFRDLAREKNITLSATPETALPCVLADKELIGIVLHNLLSNAMKYTPEGGRVSFEIARGGDNDVVLSVHDTGYGIPEKDHGRIFTKLFRASNVVAKDTDGNGLGLYLSRLIVELLGGKIWFESEEGKGSVFSFTLPVAEEV